MIVLSTQALGAAQETRIRTLHGSDQGAGLTHPLQQGEECLWRNLWQVGQ